MPRARGPGAGSRPLECPHNPAPGPGPAIPRQAGLVANFGLINRLKEFDVAYEGLSRRGDRRPDLRRKSIGTFDPEANPDYAGLARRLGGDWVSFTGGLPDPGMRSRLAEALLMPLPFSDGASTRRGTLPFGWAFGMPVVTTPPQAEEPAIVDGWNCRLAREGSRTTAQSFGVARQAACYMRIHGSLLARPVKTPPASPR